MIGPAGRAGVRGGMDIDARAHPRIRSNEADGVVDVPLGQLVGVEEQRGDGKAAASALVQPSPRPEGG